MSQQLEPAPLPRRKRRAVRLARLFAVYLASAAIVLAAVVIVYRQQAPLGSPVATVPGPDDGELQVGDARVIEGIRQSTAQYPSDGKPIRIERFYPPADGKYPIVLILCGGGGIGAHGDGIRNVARDLARRGYVALIPHYMDQTGHQSAGPPVIDRYFPTWMKTLDRAIDYARGLPGVDPERVGIMGWSLGGGLAAEVGATNAHVTAAVDYVAGMYESIINQSKRIPPTLFLHGEKDPNYPVAYARRLVRLLEKKHVVFESKIYPGQGHGFTGEAARDADRRRNAFLDKYLNPPPASADASPRT